MSKGSPNIAVSATFGKFLMLLAHIQGAQRILEVGTLGGYSTIWLARGLAQDGHLVTLELDPHHADVARRNLAFAGVTHADVRVGPASETLTQMVESGESPFDLIFIDADKPNIPTYLDRAIQLSRPGTVIVVDNVVRDGQVADPATQDPNSIGVRAMNTMLASRADVVATSLQLVGAKGYDGFCVIRVK